jgi:hypothetical protein
MRLRVWLWGAALSGVAVAATAQEAAQPPGALAKQRAWPAPAPKQKNVITRVRFPERPGTELDASPAALQRWLTALGSDDPAVAGEAFKQLFWIGPPARRALRPLVERALRDPRTATRRDSRAYKALHAIEHFAFYRPVETGHKLEAPVVTAPARWMRGTSWSHGLLGKPRAVTLTVNPLRTVTYGGNYRGLELTLVNRSGAVIEVPRAGMRIDCIAEAETKEGWVAIESPPATDRRAPKVWKLKHDFAAESAVPCYTGTLETRLRYRLTIRGQQAPVYSNIFDAKISPAQLTGTAGRLPHDHTPR